MVRLRRSRKLRGLISVFVAANPTAFDRQGLNLFYGGNW